MYTNSFTIVGCPVDLRRSRGYQRKVLEDPLMAEDHRNLGFVGTTDGVPLFKGQKRGCWPYVLRCANLPDSLSTHMANVHMHLLSANEYWELDEDANVLRRRVRGPRSAMAHLSLVVDDLLGIYQTGHFFPLSSW